MKINSVLGEIDSTDLKFILPHEHLIGGMPVNDGINMKSRSGAIKYIINEVERMLKDLHKLGVNGFCDATTVDIGRNGDYAKMAQSLSKSTGVNVFLVSGYYMPDCWLPWITESTAEKLADAITNEFEKGIEDTNIKPNVIKSSIGFTGWGIREEKSLAASALAHKRTGASIHVHSVAGTRKQTVELLKSLDVPSNRIYMAHVEARLKKEEIIWMAEQGVNMIITNWGFNSFFSHSEMIKIISKLIQLGHLDKISLSLDYRLSLCNGANDVMWTICNNPERTSFSYIINHTLPELLQNGISQNDVNTMMHLNPLKMLMK